MLVQVNSSAILGVDTYAVTVEVDIAQGMPSFIIVGLPDAAVQESRERVRAPSAISAMTFPGINGLPSTSPPPISRKSGRSTTYQLP